MQGPLLEAPLIPLDHRLEALPLAVHLEDHTEEIFIRKVAMEEEVVHLVILDHLFQTTTTNRRYVKTG